MTLALIVSVAFLVLLPLSGFLFKRWPVSANLLPEEEVHGVIILPKVSHTAMREERIARELDFLPLVEILSGSDLELKRGAIGQLARLKTPESIQILLDHRSDASLEIRYYINTALAQIKKEFDEALDAARHQIQLDIYKVSARVFLAKIYLQYAHLGLLDEKLAQSYEDEAIFHLTFVVESETPTAETFKILVECLMDRQDWLKARAVLEAAENLKLMSRFDVARKRVEILYHQRQYTEIPSELKILTQDAQLSSEWQTAVLWWGGVA